MFSKSSKLSKTHLFCAGVPNHFLRLSLLYVESNVAIWNVSVTIFSRNIETKNFITQSKPHFTSSSLLSRCSHSHFISYQVNFLRGNLPVARRRLELFHIHHTSDVLTSSLKQKRLLKWCMVSLWPYIYGSKHILIALQIIIKLILKCSPSIRLDWLLEFNLFEFENLRCEMWDARCEWKKFNLLIETTPNCLFP